MKFAKNAPPKPLSFDWKPTRGEAKLRWLPDDEFDTEARKYGIPTSKDGFAVPKKWWTLEALIIVRAKCLGVIPHEIRHIEEGHFHD